MMRAKDRNLWRERVVYGIREEDSIADGSSDDGNRPAAKLPSRVRAFKANTTRVQNGVFVGYKQNDDGLWSCPNADCDFTSPSKSGVAIHYGKMHGKAKRDKAFHGGFPVKQKYATHGTTGRRVGQFVLSLT